MKKSLLAIAIAAAVPAVASAQVTVFGIMDGGFNTTTVKTGSEVTRNQTGGNAAGALASNRIGFRGTEKIGDMTAGFHYELGMDAGGTGDLSTTGGVRRSVVSLAGGFGTVEIGRDYTPIFSLSCTLDTAACSNVQEGKGVYLNGAAAITTVRNSGQIMYTLPTMGGLTAKIAVTNRSSDPNTSGDVESTGGSVVYNAGPLMLGVAFNNQKAFSSATASVKREEMIIGGSYMVNKQLSIQVQHGDLKTGSVDTYKGTQVGARFNVSPTLLAFGSVGSGDGAVGDFEGFNVGIANSLSKRTRLYATYGQDELKKAGSPTRERSQFAVGINHAF
jgi:predicted porin